MNRLPALAACAIVAAVAALPIGRGETIASPMPTQTPDSQARYTNAKPVPQGGALGGTTIGPRYAADAFHIDWDAFCEARPTRCSAEHDPHYVRDDARMVADTLPTTEGGAGVSDICATSVSIAGNAECQTDVGVYYATTSDPLVTITCTASWGCGNGPTGVSGNLNGSRIYLPFGAITQPGGDGHLSVKEPSGVICQFWSGGNPDDKPIESRSLRIGSGACGPPDETTEGDTLFEGGGYAAGDEMSRGFLRPEDLVGDNGDGSDRVDPDSFYHALYGGFSNNRSGRTWPSNGSDGQCTAQTTINGAMPVEGMYLYIDRAGFGAIDRWQPPANLVWLKRALGSLHRHGMIDLDSSGCTKKANGLYTNTLEWGSASYALGGGHSPIDAFLTSVIEPHDASYSSEPGGREKAIYRFVSGKTYTFDVLWYEDVPGLSAANFHWLDLGCAEIAVRGRSLGPC